MRRILPSFHCIYLLPHRICKGIGKKLCRIFRLGKAVSERADTQGQRAPRQMLIEPCAADKRGHHERGIFPAHHIKNSIRLHQSRAPAGMRTSACVSADGKSHLRISFPIESGGRAKKFASRTSKRLTGDIYDIFHIVMLREVGAYLFVCVFVAVVAIGADIEKLRLYAVPLHFRRHECGERCGILPFI